MHNISCEIDPNINCIKNSIVKIIFLTFITLFIYYPIWFLKVRKTINKLKSKKKIGSIVPTIVLSMTVAYIIISFLEGFMEGFNPDNIYNVYLANIPDYLNYLLIAGDICLFVLCFKIRRILLDHYAERISISILATFFFQIFYLQHKLNKI